MCSPCLCTLSPVPPFSHPYIWYRFLFRNLLKFFVTLGLPSATSLILIKDPLLTSCNNLTMGQVWKLERKLCADRNVCLTGHVPSCFGKGCLQQPLLVLFSSPQLLGLDALNTQVLQNSHYAPQVYSYSLKYAALGLP